MASAPRDRRVLLLLALVVAVILALNVGSALVPGMDGLLAGVPVIVAILVGGTLIVLLGTAAPPELTRPVSRAASCRRPLAAVSGATRCVAPCRRAAV